MLHIGFDSFLPFARLLDVVGYCFPGGYISYDPSTYRHIPRNPIAATAATAATTAAAAPAVAIAGVAAYCAPIAAHAYKANTRSAIADDTVRMWLRPINKTVVFRATGGGEAQYAVLDGKVLEEGSLEEKLAAWTTLPTPPPGDIAPEDMGLHAKYQRVRKYGDCLRLCRVDAIWHGGYSFCVIQLGRTVEYKIRPGKVAEATMEEWLE
eukprot:jgi/Tetstr1/441730/TSEL_029953.t1